MKIRHLCAAAAIFALGLSPTSAFAQGEFEQGIEKCHSLGSAEARLKCYEGLSFSGRPAEQTSSQWRLVRTPTPNGETVSAMRAADTARSDPDFAGFSIRCGKEGLEYILIIINPMPPRAHPTVIVGTGANTVAIPAAVLPSGAALLLSDVAALAAGPWQSQPALAVTIRHEDAVIHGVVPLAGFGQTMRQISAACPQR